MRELFSSEEKIADLINNDFPSDTKRILIKILNEQ